MGTSQRCSARALRYVMLVAALAPLAVVGQQAEVAPAEALDTVTVFGSRMQNRTAFDSAVPIDVFSARDIAAAAPSGELGQVLQALSPSINMPRASSSGTSDSVRAIQVRGLAPDQVLVLVNGKRWHTNASMDIEGLFPGTVAVDLNAIPVEAIDHIEVLRDGAGAMYGSDAVAGVVNIVLKSGMGPTDLRVGYGENHTHFAPTNSSITDGRNRTIDGSTSLRLGEQGSIRFGASYQNRGATNRAGPSSASWTSYNSTPADLALDGQVLFASGDPKLESTGVFYDANLPLTDALKFYSFATANWRGSRGAAFFRYPGDPGNVAAIYPNGFRPISTGTSNDLGLVAGLRGVAAGWNWDLSAAEGYNHFGYGLRNSLNASLGPASPTGFHVSDFVSTQQTVSLDLTRELPAGLAAPLIASAGVQQIFEHYHTGAGDPASYAAGPYTVNGFGEMIPPGSQGDSGLRPQDVVHLSRNVSALYVELENDVTPRLLLDVAGRYSHYSDHGSATTGKFAARFKLSEQLLLRGAISNSFRAPALAQTGIRFATLNFNSTGTGLQNNAWLPPSDPLAQLLGAQPLNPERSVNITAGLAWRSPARTFATVDLYQVRITDRIVPSTQLSVPVGYPDIASVQFLTNTLDTTTRGLDLVAGQELSLGAGTLKLTAAFNRNYLHQDRERNPNVAGGQVLVPLEYGSPATKLVLSGDWSWERWGARAQANRFGTVYAFSFDSNLPTINGWNVQRYDPLWSFDLEGRVKLGHGLQFVAGGTDVFNRYPARTTFDGSYGGAFPYNFVHPLGINGAYYYLNLSFTTGE
ncbi:MAG: TonB-dependent receptor [Proteobacteria bacterium]|nr:TonB-dependent receptor [Pseudomonadota bacterium]